MIRSSVMVNTHTSAVCRRRREPVGDVQPAGVAGREEGLGRGRPERGRPPLPGPNRDEHLEHVLEPLDHGGRVRGGGRACATANTSCRATPRCWSVVTFVATQAASADFSPPLSLWSASECLRTAANSAGFIRAAWRDGRHYPATRPPRQCENDNCRPIGFA